MPAAADKALEPGDMQWAMELADRLIAANTNAAAARRLKTKALREPADKTVNAPTRNRCLHSARELADSGRLPGSPVPDWMADGVLLPVTDAAILCDFGMQPPAAPAGDRL